MPDSDAHSPSQVLPHACLPYSKARIHNRRSFLPAIIPRPASAYPGTPFRSGPFWPQREHLPDPGFSDPVPEAPDSSLHHQPCRFPVSLLYRKRQSPPAPFSALSDLRLQPVCRTLCKSLLPHILQQAPGPHPPRLREERRLLVFLPF